MQTVSLKARMSLSVMALVLIIMAGLGGIALHYFEKSFRQLIADQQSTLVQQITTRIDTQLKQASALIVATADSFPRDLLNNADLTQEYLDTQLGLGTTSLFDNGIFLFSDKGLMLAEYLFKPGRRGRDYSFREYFQSTLRTGEPQISDPYVSSQNHAHPALNFTAPIRDDEGRLLAVLAGSVDLTQKNFLGGLSEVRVGQTGYLYLFNTQRLMIMHPDPQRIMQKDVPLGANIWFDRAIEGFEGTELTVNSRGLHTLVTFKRLNQGRWILAANFPEKEAFLPIVQARQLFFFGSALILLFSLLVTWWVTRLLVAPLIRLTDQVAKCSSVYQGTLLYDPKRGDEISALALTFDQLMAEVYEQRRAADNRLTFLQRIMDTIPHPTYYQDFEGSFLGCNTAMQTLCGKPLDLIVGTSIREHFPLETAQRLSAGEESLDQGDNRVMTSKVALSLHSGESLDALIYKALLRDSQGKPQGIVTSLVDIRELKAIETTLAAEREFTLSLLQNSATPCFVIDPEQRVLIWTRAIEELTGLKAAEVLGTDLHWRAFYPEARPCLADVVLKGDFAAAIELYPLVGNSALAQDGLQSEGWLRLYSGKSKYLTFDAAPIHDQQGEIVAVIQTFHDLTNLKHAEDALRETQASYHALVDNSPDAILVHRQGVVLYSNRAALKLFHAEKKEALVGLSISDLTHPDSHENILRQIDEVESKVRDQLYVEERILCVDGQELNVEVGLSLTHYAGASAVQSVLRDITLRKAEQERIWQQANFDALTGLPNRSLFMDRLAQTLGRSERDGLFTGLLFVDLDHFKQVNDSLGHDNGDELLRQVAKRMVDCLRQTDTVARIGGDEFTVILPVLSDMGEIRIAAKRLLRSLETPFTLPDGQGQISCSIGGAVYPRDGKSIDDLMCVADASMYQVKQTGRNGFYLPNAE